MLPEVEEASADSTGQNGILHAAPGGFVSPTQCFLSESLRNGNG